MKKDNRIATDHNKVLKTVLDGIDYVMLKDVLVKPLDPVMITKEIQKPKATGEFDENGAAVYDGTETVKEEFESMFRIGIVLQVPADLKDLPYAPGDKIVFPQRSAAYFELFKDAMVVKPYDIVAKVK